MSVIRTGVFHSHTVGEHGRAAGRRGSDPPAGPACGAGGPERLGAGRAGVTGRVGPYGRVLPRAPDGGSVQHVGAGAGSPTARRLLCVPRPWGRLAWRSPVRPGPNARERDARSRSREAKRGVRTPQLRKYGHAVTNAPGALSGTLDHPNESHAHGPHISAGRTEGRRAVGHRTRAAPARPRSARERAPAPRRSVPRRDPGRRAAHGRSAVRISRSAAWAWRPGPKARWTRASPAPSRA